MSAPAGPSVPAPAVTHDGASREVWHDAWLIDTGTDGADACVYWLVPPAVGAARLHVHYTVPAPGGGEHSSNVHHAVGAGGVAACVRDLARLAEPDADRRRAWWVSRCTCLPAGVGS